MTLREPLDKIEARILGVLVEKELTTPDGYPLSLHALQAGCNQKSNRDPVLSLDEQSLSEALLRLRLHRLVREVHEAGARVVKYAHEGRATLEVDTPALALLAELLLRGPQTAGELRGRLERMTPVPSLADLQGLVQPLLARGLVVRLPPAPGSRAERYAETLTGDAGASAADAGAARNIEPPRASVGAADVGATPEKVGLDARVAALERAVAQLQRELETLRLRPD